MDRMKSVSLVAGGHRLKRKEKVTLFSAPQVPICLTSYPDRIDQWMPAGDFTSIMTKATVWDWWPLEGLLRSSIFLLSALSFKDWKHYSRSQVWRICYRSIWWGSKASTLYRWRSSVGWLFLSFFTAIFLSYWHLMLETEHRIRKKKLNISNTMNKKYWPISYIEYKREVGLTA